LSYLTKLLSTSGRSKDATVTYSRLKESFEYFKDRSNFGPYHGNVGYIATSLGDYNYAKYIYQDAIKRLPTAENYTNLAIIEYDFLKNFDKGAEYAKLALELEPNMPNSSKIRSLIQSVESATNP
jgi:tetratricopeptide (TPR) repeat protein